METRFDGLTEFISRQGRMKILEIVLEDFKTPAEVSKRLNITKKAVYGWINDRKRHPSNKNALKLLRILKKENEEKLKEILIEELQTFQKLILEL